MSARGIPTSSSQLRIFDHKRDLQQSKYTQLASEIQQEQMQLLFSNNVTTCVYLNNGKYFVWTFPVSIFEQHLCKSMKEEEPVLVGSCANHISAGLAISLQADYDFRVYIKNWEPLTIHKTMMEFFISNFPGLSISPFSLQWTQSLTEASLTYTIGRIDCNFRGATLPLPSPVSVNSSEGFEISLLNRHIACMNQRNYCVTKKQFTKAISNLVNKKYPLSNQDLIRNLEFRVLYKHTQGYKITPNSYQKELREQILQNYYLGTSSCWKGGKDFSVAYQRYLKHHYLSENSNLDAASILDVFNLLNLLPSDIATTVHLAAAWTHIVPPMVALENPLTLLIEEPTCFEHVCNLLYAAALAQNLYNPLQHAFIFKKNESMWVLHMQHNGHTLDMNSLAKLFPDSWNHLQILIASKSVYSDALKRLFFLLELEPLFPSREFYCQVIKNHQPASLQPLNLCKEVELEKKSKIEPALPPPLIVTSSVQDPLVPMIISQKQNKAKVNKKNERRQFSMQAQPLLLKIKASQNLLQFKTWEADSQRLQALVCKAFQKKIITRSEENKIFAVLAEFHLRTAQRGFSQALKGFTTLLEKRVVLLGASKSPLISGIWLDYVDLLVHQSLERVLHVRCFSNHLTDAIYLPVHEKSLSCSKPVFALFMESIFQRALVETKRLSVENWIFLVQTHTRMLPQHYTIRTPDLICSVARYLCQTFLQTPKSILHHPHIFSSLLIQVSTLLKRTDRISRKLALTIEAQLPRSTHDLPQIVQESYLEKAKQMAAYLFEQKRDLQIGDLILATRRELSPRMYQGFHNFIEHLSQKRHKELNTPFNGLTDVKFVLKGILGSLPLLVIEERLLYQRVADLIQHVDAHPVNRPFLMEVEELVNKMGQFSKEPIVLCWNITCQTLLIRMHLESLKNSKELNQALNLALNKLLSFKLLNYMQDLSIHYAFYELIKKDFSSKLGQKDESPKLFFHLKDHNINNFYLEMLCYFYADAFIRNDFSLLKKYIKSILFPLRDHVIEKALVNPVYEVLMEEIDDLFKLCIGGLGLTLIMIHLMPSILPLARLSRRGMTSKSVPLQKIKKYVDETPMKKLISNFTKHFMQKANTKLESENCFHKYHFLTTKLYYKLTGEIGDSLGIGSNMLLAVLTEFCQHIETLKKNKKSQKHLDLWLIWINTFKEAGNNIAMLNPQFKYNIEKILGEYNISSTEKNRHVYDDFSRGIDEKKRITL